MGQKKGQKKNNNKKWKWKWKWKEKKLKLNLVTSFMYPNKNLKSSSSLSLLAATSMTRVLETSILSRIKHSHICWRRLNEYATAKFFKIKF